MSKYDKKVVFNYVMGNDIKKYNIDDLENDWEFMKEVFEYTKDKKIYDLCDEKLQSNLDLIKYLIDKFKDDKKFILQISSNFLNKSQDNLNKLEIQIILEDIYKDDEIFKNKFSNKIDIEMFYTFERTDYELALEQTDDDLKKFLQSGFYYFFEEYKDRQLIIDFIAKKMINEIFDFRNNDLEELIHSIYKDKRQFDKTTSTKFIIDYISDQDYALANYLSVHIGLIEELKKSVDRIFRNFEHYNKNKYDDVIDGIRDHIEDYSKENNYYDDILLKKFISKDLQNKDIWINLGEELTFSVQKKDEFGFYEDEISLNNFHTDEYGFYDIENTDYENIKNDILYIKLKEDIKRMLNNNEVYSRYIRPYKKEKNNSKCKILKFESKKEQ